MKTKIVWVFIATGSVVWAAHSHHEHTKDSRQVVFEQFPTSRDLLRPDVGPVIDQIIVRHGRKECETVILTSEFHTHLGIYAIVGAKMGIRAREYFGVGLDELTVESFAGSQPPISCLNDGLQASTGATLGHGTISLSSVTAPRPTAKFTYDGTIISLELKEAYWQQVRQDIGGIIDQHGLGGSKEVGHMT
ncbi:MAG: formylmethanofuran dehydrogenase subunit E family protein [Phycisphaerales bacterium]|nr:MAG: formylmethanofuran dehydrogenase subunit E family protein [Phycisphaerales bacterium]